ncbi:hypothetical protein CC117_30525 [Parafrankia colletiae]|uniref:Uncharacterized protein n=1 Tax=Parafrankia colletiae TaxID=573497 RepID=A0A1S1Q394_9ACTN|nr:hypothetical protein [Parafrankia colletiae]MCK9904213.1 hypothetical protein [Frankia sp. Cpl3]OHV28430.1 hypothetical protein CC117_30525 [Parafrankia colletiae]
MNDKALLPPVVVPRAAATPAERLLSERILLLADAHGLREPPGLDPCHGGLAVCGGRTDPFTKIEKLRAGGYSGPLVGDPALYTTRVATADEPFVHADGGLFGSGLDLALDGQISRGATVALTPTGYLLEGDSAALRATVEAAENLARIDTVVVIPAAVGWLADPYVELLTEALAAIPHPVALALGGQLNPLDGEEQATVNLRRLLVTVPGVAPWRTDFAAFDGVAHGAPFASMGATAGLRHIIPPGERALTVRKGGATPPTVLFPELLRFTSGHTLATRYANHPPPTCGCVVCRGRPLTRFDGYDGDIRAEANAHNAAAWNELLPALFREPGLGERQALWKKTCVAAYQAHEVENVRLRQMNAFKPPRDVVRFATLPVTHAPTTLPAQGQSGIRPGAPGTPPR